MGCGFFSLRPQSSQRPQPDYSTPIAFVDPATEQVFAVCVGKPSDPNFEKAHCAVYQAMDDARKSASFKDKELSHKRGEFPAVNVGVSFGHGPQKPHNLDVGDHGEMLDSLLQNESVIRMANFGSGGSIFLAAPFSFEQSNALPELQHPSISGRPSSTPSITPKLIFCTSTCPISNETLREAFSQLQLSTLGLKYALTRTGIA